MEYKTLNQHYKELFGCKVYKLSVDAGFTCPNRDGTCGNNGCIFCSGAGSGEFAESGTDIVLQLQRAKERVKNKTKDGKFVAYFQAFTNTYAPIERLENIYSKALGLDYIVGLAIATRPDCLPDEVIKLLGRLNKIKPISVELGLQTSDDTTAEYIRRGYKTEVYYDAVKRLKKENIEVVTHIIIGLPFEDKNKAIKTTESAVLAGTDGVKFHLLHILKNTDLAAEYEKGVFKCLELEEYAQILTECIRLLPKETVVHRITGDGAKKDLIAPLWSGDKKRVLNFLNKKIREM